MNVRCPSCGHTAMQVVSDNKPTKQQLLQGVQHTVQLKCLNCTAEFGILKPEGEK